MRPEKSLQVARGVQMACGFCRGAHGQSARGQSVRERRWYEGKGRGRKGKRDAGRGTRQGLRRGAKRRDETRAREDLTVVTVDETVVRLDNYGSVPRGG